MPYLCKGFKDSNGKTMFRAVILLGSIELDCHISELLYIETLFMRFNTNFMKCLEYLVGSNV